MKHVNIVCSQRGCVNEGDVPDSWRGELCPTCAHPLLAGDVIEHAIEPAPAPAPPPSTPTSVDAITQPASLVAASADPS